MIPAEPRFYYILFFHVFHPSTLGYYYYYSSSSFSSSTPSQAFGLLIISLYNGGQVNLDRFLFIFLPLPLLPYIASITHDSTSTSTFVPLSNISSHPIPSHPIYYLILSIILFYLLSHPIYHLILSIILPYLLSYLPSHLPSTICHY